jgi:hypothetical protein
MAAAFTSVSRACVGILVAVGTCVTTACSAGPTRDTERGDAASDARAAAIDVGAADAGEVTTGDAGDRCGPAPVDVAALVAQLPAFDVGIAGSCTAEELARMRLQAASTTSGSAFFGLFSGSCRECAITALAVGEGIGTRPWRSFVVSEDAQGAPKTYVDATEAACVMAVTGNLACAKAVAGFNACRNISCAKCTDSKARAACVSEAYADPTGPCFVAGGQVIQRDCSRADLQATVASGGACASRAEDTRLVDIWLTRITRTCGPSQR